MTRFEESAIRNSVADLTPATLPYWHPSSQFSSLIDPHESHEERFQYQHQPLAGEQMPPPPPLTRPCDDGLSNTYSQYGNFAHLAQELDQDHSSMPQYSPSVAVKTPTGPRTMRRPGLAGAPALVCGRYCCHWTVGGGTCHQQFEDAKALNDHIRAHHVRGAGTFVCQWQGCDKSFFPTANKLVRHVHSHTGYKPFQCPSCTQAFVTKDQLDKHLTTHTGAKDFICTWPGCGRSFAVKHALDGHVNSVHLKAKKHVCPHCLQAFDDSSNLSKHKKQVHNPKTGIRCPARHTHECTYVDSRKDKMKEHCERERHGLETTTDPYRWNLWVQQFKSTLKKAELRQCRDTSDTPISRASSISSTLFTTTTPYWPPPIECSKEDCNIPVCLPCDMLCNDHELYPDPFALCNDTECGPCDSCNDPDCDPNTRQECHIEPCTIQHEDNDDDDDDDSCSSLLLQETCTSTSCSGIPHCLRSATSTPSQPPTPYTYSSAMQQQQPAFYDGGGGGGGGGGGYHPIGHDTDSFSPDADHPFQLNSTQLEEYMFMTP